MASCWKEARQGKVKSIPPEKPGPEWHQHSVGTLLCRNEARYCAGTRWRMFQPHREKLLHGVAPVGTPSCSKMDDSLHSLGSSTHRHRKNTPPVTFPAENAPPLASNQSPPFPPLRPPPPPPCLPESSVINTPLDTGTLTLEWLLEHSLSPYITFFRGSRGSLPSPIGKASSCVLVQGLRGSGAQEGPCRAPPATWFAV